MLQNLYIYDNDQTRRGVYVSEHLANSYDGGDCEEITIEIPDEMESYQTIMGETMVRCGNYFYSLDECVGIDKNSQVFIKPMEPGQRQQNLKIVSRNGRKSLAFVI